MNLLVPARVVLAEAVAKFMSIIDLTVIKSSSSEDRRLVPVRILLPVIVTSTRRLLEGMEPPHVAILRPVYTSIALAVRHGVTISVPANEVIHIARSGLMHPDRATRVAAG